MEAEDFSDSLDEDSNYESIDNGCFESNTNIPNLEHDDAHQNNFDTKEAQVKPSPEVAEGLFLPINLKEIKEDMIPYYEKNLSKSELSNAKYNSETESNVNNKIKRKPWRKKSLIPVGKLKSRSYLDMFHAKIGLDNEKKSLNDTSRATASDLTPKSSAACEDSDRPSPFSKARDCSETDSFYEGSSFSKRDYSVSLASFDSKFCSVSQQNLGMFRPKSRRKYIKPVITKIPELGGLGPEIQKDKLETLKRRQLYGQKVSENNKIKMQERKLLQNLHQEIKRCNNI